MRTEELLRGDRPTGTRSASPALQDPVPPEWQLTDAKGRPAPLSSAGYVLHFGHIYELRVAPFADTEAPSALHLLSAPAFLKRQAGPATLTRHGQTCHCLTFRVQREYGWLRQLFKGPYEIAWGEIEVECSVSDSWGGSRVAFACPVVARTAWSIGLIFLLVVGYLGGWLVGQLGNVLKDCWTRGAWPWNNWQHWWQDNPQFWLWPLLIAALNPVACLLTHLYRLWQRSGELERRYRQR
jgi:hypothetical protein